METIEKKAGNVHPTTASVIQLLKKNSRITDQELANQLQFKSVQVARGWRVVAEETMKEWNWQD